jgi:hypothetical protein
LALLPKPDQQPTRRRRRACLALNRRLLVVPHSQHLLQPAEDLAGSQGSERQSLRRRQPRVFLLREPPRRAEQRRHLLSEDLEAGSEVVVEEDSARRLLLLSLLNRLQLRRAEDSRSELLQLRLPRLRMQTQVLLLREACSAVVSEQQQLLHQPLRPTQTQLPAEQDKEPDQPHLHLRHSACSERNPLHPHLRLQLPVCSVNLLLPAQPHQRVAEPLLLLVDCLALPLSQARQVGINQRRLRH